MLTVPRALGAEVVLVEQTGESTPAQVSGADLEQAARVARQIARERGAYYADQFRSLSNFRAHYFQTGPELWRQSGGRIHAFCDFARTGGTFAGCSAALKERDPTIRCFLVEPRGAAILAGQPVTLPKHRIQGGGYSRELPLLGRAQVDGYLQVADQEAVHIARRLAREEGIFGGFSSGANVAAALQLLRGPCRGNTIAVMICDSGLKYLSTELWE